jgi:hypothetical protein
VTVDGEVADVDVEDPHAAPAIVTSRRERPLKRTLGMRGVTKGTASLLTNG